jgi:hypothetical protein
MAANEIRLHVRFTPLGKVILWAAQRVGPAHDRGERWARLAGAALMWLARKVNVVRLDAEGGQ